MENEKNTMVIDDDALDGVNGGNGGYSTKRVCKDCKVDLKPAGLNYKCPNCFTLYDPAGNKINTSRITKAT